ncbi:MAG TPA: extracellular solute-binding protein [Rhodopila sp.]|uniref:extracellular solute-binding protein n=1 Tax=Rhodopila sp. TaxID=2480087 RepID=UPI002BF0C41E|nr:extracellular solute-binding protein [Rhodopila sp.]HVY15427.1 extracellular solute-binding protein [Rhodopila sp.]
MLFRTLLAAAALLAAPRLAVMPASASPSDLTIVTRDNAFLRSVQAAYVQPFTAVTGLPVQQETWEGGLDSLRTHAKAPANAWDLVLLDADELSVACGEGLLEKLDWSAIGGKDHYLPIGVSDCGVGAVIENTVLAWDKDKLPVTPTWSDFWDVAKYPGKRGLRKGVRGNLEIALMADGVAPGDVYKTLSTSDGVDRAFRKLDQLKPYIEWWSSESEAARILASGDVLMTSAPSGQIVTAAEKEHRGFGVQFANSLYEVQSWAILKGSPALRNAQQFLYFTGMPAVEVRLLKESGDSGLAKGLNDGLPPELLTTSPGNPANLGAGLRIDAGFWHDNLAKLKPRFEAWLGH